METYNTSAITGSSEPMLAYRDQLDHAGHFRIAGHHTSGISVATHRKDAGGLGWTLPMPKADVFSCFLQLRPVGPTVILRECGHRPSVADLQQGSLTIHDMRESWRGDIRRPFHMVHFFLARSAIVELADELGIRGNAELNPQLAEHRQDEIMAAFAGLVLPALEKPFEADALFFGHLFSAIRIHIIQTYGNFQVITEPSRGKLAPWQERRACELLEHNLMNDLTIDMLAAECRLSPTHFIRAFKASMGSPPHRWRLLHRIEKAKIALQTTEQSIGGIAVEFGFADQTHFTRAFSKLVGLGPGAWRRAMKV